MQEFHVGTNEAGQRFDKYLHKLLPEAGNAFLYKMLRKKNITLNGKKADGKEKLAVGDQVSLFLSQDTFSKFAGNTVSLTPRKAISLHFQPEILLETEHFLIVNKPAGVLTQKAKREDYTLNEWLLDYLLASGVLRQEDLRTFHPSVCNRLDRNTSGIVLCGKTLAGSQFLNEQIRKGKIKKYYRTFVKGEILAGSTLEGYLYKEDQTNRVVVYRQKNEIPAGREAVYIKTSYQPLQHFQGMTYLEIELHTGKTHQIRAHLSSIDHPILGDSKYGDPTWNLNWQKKYHFKNQQLHAYRIEFPKETGIGSCLNEKKIIAKEPAIFKKILTEA